MNVIPSLSTIGADDAWTSNLCSLRLEELVDASRTPGDWPPGLPGPIAGEARLLPQAACVVAQVDDVAMALALRSVPQVSQTAERLDTAIAGRPELAALAARRLRRLTLSPWFAAPGQDPALTPAARQALTLLLAQLDRARTRHAPALQSVPFAPHDAAAASIRASTSDPRLSARELQVARYVSLGMTNKQIAIALKLSPNTIKRHLARILRRLGMGKRSALASWYAVQTLPVEPKPADGSGAAAGPGQAPRVSTPRLPTPTRAGHLHSATLHQ